MSSSRRGLRKDERLYRRIVLQDRCLALILRKEKKDSGNKIGRVKEIEELNNRSNAKDFAYEGGYLVFQDFQRENQGCYWNEKHVDAITKIEYKGFLLPSTLLVSGSDYCLEVVRSAWSRRVLRSPPGYFIKRLGDVNAMDMTVLPQTQFTPLAESLCMVVGQLNSDRQMAALPSIKKSLHKHFPEMYVPSAEILHKALGTLIKERKLYHTGDGYFVVTPHTYKIRSTSPPPPQRQMLMTNEEAIELLHGRTSTPAPYCNRSVQTNNGGNVSIEPRDRTIVPSTGLYRGDSFSDPSESSGGRIERSLSLRILRGKDNRSYTSSLSRSNSCKLSPEKAKNITENINLKTDPAHKTIDKGEKVSVFSRLFRRASLRRIRGRSKSPVPGTRNTFCAQFPPVEWSDPDYVHYHSIGTQTLNRDIRKGRSRSESRDKHRAKSNSLESHMRQKSSEEHKISPRHRVSKSSTLPRKPFNSSVTPDVDSTTSYRSTTSSKCHSLPSSNVNSPKMSPQTRRVVDNRSSYRLSPRKFVAEHTNLRLNNEVRLTGGGAPTFVKDAGINVENHNGRSAPINNIIHDYRPTAFSSVRPEDKPSQDGRIKMLERMEKAKEAIMRQKSNVENRPNQLNDKITSQHVDDAMLDFEVEFKSRAAQKILQGISDSVDTLVDLNNCDRDAEQVPTNMDAKTRTIWEWDSTYFTSNKYVKNRNNSSESILYDYDRKLPVSKSAYCMQQSGDYNAIPIKITSISAGNTPLYETAA
ncbi:STOX1 (predicted) [Pycnogonum litorale]